MRYACIRRKGIIMKTSIFRSIVVFLLILCLSTSLFLVSCGEDVAEEPDNSDVLIDPPIDDPTIEDPTIDEPTVEDPTIEEPTVEDPTIDEPTVEDPTINEPTVEDPTIDEPTIEDPTIDDPPVEEPTDDDPTVEPEPPYDTDKPGDDLTVLPEPDEARPVLPDNIGSNDQDSANPEIDITKAVMRGLKSAVSIYCNFTATAYYPWGNTPTTNEYATTGSGVIYSLTTDGSAFIITNFHVVYDGTCDTENNISDDINVYLYGMESSVYAIPATYVGGSANYDIAVLRVDQSEVLKSAIERGVVAPVNIADSDLLAPGDTTLAIGNPSADTVSGISVTKGIVSVDSEYIEMNSVDGSGVGSFRVIRTDTAVNPGNSGGGLFNDNGELIGIVNAKITTDTIDNIGYAIPTKVAIAVAENIIDNCYEKENESVLRPIIGVSTGVTELLTSYDEESGRIIKTETIIVSEIVPGGLAEGNLKVDDVIKAARIGEREITVYRAHMLIDFLLNARVGDVVSIDVLREGEPVTVNLTITEESIIAS